MVERKGHIVQAVDRSLAILEAMAREGSPMSLGEISAEVELTRSTVHRLLSTLMSRGFARQDVATGRYSLGFKALEVGTSFLASLDIRSMARPHLRRLAQSCGETANLAMLEGLDVVYIDQVEAESIIKMRARLGSRGPAHCTGSGKVLLASLPEEDLERLLRGRLLKRYTTRTIADPDRLRQELSRVRKEGYALDFGEMEPAVRCAAAAVRDHEGQIVCAVSISGPDTRIEGERLRSMSGPSRAPGGQEISQWNWGVHRTAAMRLCRHGSITGRHTGFRARPQMERFHEMETKSGPPPKQGLYDPGFEHDACGIGFAVHIKGRGSHEIVRQALNILLNLTHRGGCGSEPNTGDGAGILMQIPHGFLRKACAERDLHLPSPGHYAVGMIFLPVDREERDKCERAFGRIVREEGQSILGWRTVPTDDRSLGATARAGMPLIRQVFIGRSPDPGSDLDFERKLYVIRKRAEKAIGGRQGGGSFYVASLSAKTIVYKGMLTAEQVGEFYTDLADPAVETALALVHSRYSTNTFPSWERAHPYRYIIHNGEINTLRGNVNWMHARQSTFQSELFRP